MILPEYLALIIACLVFYLSLAVIKIAGDNCHLPWQGDGIRTFTIRDFRTRPRQAQEAMRQETEAVLTSNGRPVALLVPVDAGSLDDDLMALRNARAVRALAGLSEQARKSGADRMRPAEVDALIANTRKARRGTESGRP